MPKVSCATLETVMNLAALNSVYQSHEHIQKEDIIEALLQVVYKLQKTDKETDSSELQKIAVHEAAHAVVGEVLHPGSIGIVTVRGSQGVIGGMANGCATYAQNEEEFLDEVTKTLAGRAGVSLIYGVMDIQASADIEQADKLMDIWQCHFAGGGFVGIESGDNRIMPGKSCMTWSKGAVSQWSHSGCKFATFKVASLSLHGKQVTTVKIL